MPDVMCFDKTCPKRNKCHRFTAEPTRIQSYFTEKLYSEEQGCSYFWPVVSMLPPIVTENMNKVYIDNGHADRAAYLKHLSEEYGLPISLVTSLAHILGKSEDFDGLISALEDAVLTLENENE